MPIDCPSPPLVGASSSRRNACRRESPSLQRTPFFLPGFLASPPVRCPCARRSSSATSLAASRRRSCRSTSCAIGGEAEACRRSTVTSASCSRLSDQLRAPRPSSSPPPEKFHSFSSLSAFRRSVRSALAGNASCSSPLLGWRPYSEAMHFRSMLVRARLSSPLHCSQTSLVSSVIPETTAFVQSAAHHQFRQGWRLQGVY